MLAKWQTFWRSLGPGILFASTAIGVSHLVQATRAGADYGMALLWAVVLANLFKYPFFEYGSRYASAAGESLIDGYRRQGKAMLWLYFLVTLGSMFFVTAAVGAVTSGFMYNLFQLEGLLNPLSTTCLLFSICVGILMWGQYKVLDRLIKVIGSVLLFATLFAFVMTLLKGPASDPFRWFEPAVLVPGGKDFAFLIALMGWMPTAVELSAWNSLWTLERHRAIGAKPPLRETLREFNFGYLASALLAPCFLVLGAFLLYGTGRVMPEGSAAFASGIVQLYAESIGPWSRWFIAAAAFSIMFGTCIAVFDGYARSTERVFELLRKDWSARFRERDDRLQNRREYNWSLALVAIGALVIVIPFGASLKALVDLATSISFLIAPVIAIANFRLVSSRRLPADARPGKFMRTLSYLGIAFLSGFALLYLWG